MNGQRIAIAFILFSMICGVASAYYNVEEKEVVVDQSTMQMFDKVLPDGVYFTGHIWLFNNGGRTTYGAGFPAVDAPRPYPAFTPTPEPNGGI